MRRVCAVLIGVALWLPAAAQGQTPAAPGPAARDAVTSPTKPPAEVAPPIRPPSETSARPLSAPEMRELIEAAQATAKATREAVDYSRVTPDILTQILAKLDKIEDKLVKVEVALKGGTRRR